jgi:adenylate kinase
MLLLLLLASGCRATGPVAAAQRHSGHRPIASPSEPSKSDDTPVNTERLVLLGPPASGKGTQGEHMQRAWGVAVTSVGEVLRQEAAAGTALGQEAAKYLNAGELVPDCVALASVAGWLGAHRMGFVFDGFPRTVGQAQALEKILEERATPLTAVLWLELASNVIAERVSRRLVCAACGRTFGLGWQVARRDATCPVCGGALQCRHDDDPATLARRLEQYRQHTEPLLDFYAQRRLLRRIDAGQPAERVFTQIEAALAQPRVRPEVAA